MWFKVCLKATRRVDGYTNEAFKGVLLGHDPAPCTVLLILLEFWGTAIDPVFALDETKAARRGLTGLYNDDIDLAIVVVLVVVLSVMKEGARDHDAEHRRSCGQ